MQAEKEETGLIEPLKRFGGRFQVEVQLDKDLLVRKESRFFLLNKILKTLTSDGFFCSGIYLGRIEGTNFFPSFDFLSMIARAKANKVVVDSRTEWLYVCGRDIFKQGIRHVSGSTKKGDYSIITNEHDECLGYGRFVDDFDKIRRGVAVKNLLDLGDFLRREKSAS